MANGQTEHTDSQKFIDAFGDMGARWFLQGRSFADCAPDFIRQLRDDHANELGRLTQEFDQERTELNEKLSAARNKLTAIGLKQ